MSADSSPSAASTGKAGGPPQPQALVDLRQLVSEIPDFPKPGILFRDLTPLMRDPDVWQEVIRRLAGEDPRVRGVRFRRNFNKAAALRAGFQRARGRFVITLDADLPMKHAVDALASHSAMCLPVWDSYQQRFVDVFTCTDLVDIVLYTHRALAGSAAEQPHGAPRGEAQQAIERCQLRDLHGLKRSKPTGFVMASVDDSLYHGCAMLRQYRLDCLPLGDTSSSTSLLHLLLPEQLLAFIVASPELQQAAPLLFAASLREVVLPHCAPPRTAGRALRLSDALAMLSERQLVQALPIVDETGALIDVLSSRDVRHLASHSHTDDLTTPIELSLRSLPPSPVRLHTCRPTDTVGSAIRRLANADVGQLVCVDSSGAVCGVISSSDLLSSLLEPQLPTRVEG